MFGYPKYLRGCNGNLCTDRNSGDACALSQELKFVVGNEQEKNRVLNDNITTLGIGQGS